MFASIEIEQTASEAWVGHVEAGEQVRRVSVRESSFAAIMTEITRAYCELVPLPSPPVHEEAVPAPAAAPDGEQASPAALEAILRPSAVARQRRLTKAAHGIV